MSTLIHAEMVLGGLFTGALIGFFWHPAAAVAALLAAALGILGSRGPERAERHGRS